MDRPVARSRSAAALLLGLLAGSLAMGRTAGGQVQERTLTGRVVDAEDHTPVSGATVFVVHGAMETRTTQRGTFRLRVPAGPITIAVNRTGFRRVSIQVPREQTD